MCSNPLAFLFAFLAFSQADLDNCLCVPVEEHKCRSLCGVEGHDMIAPHALDPCLCPIISLDLTKVLCVVEDLSERWQLFVRRFGERRGGSGGCGYYSGGWYCDRSGHAINHSSGEFGWLRILISVHHGCVMCERAMC